MTRRPGRPAELGVRRAHRVELQLGEEELRRAIDAAAGRPLAACLREWAMAWIAARDAADK